MKRNLIMMLLLFTMYTITSESIRYISPNLLGDVIIGTDVGELNYVTSLAGGRPSPIAFEYSKDGIKVIDQNKNVINRYTTDLIFIDNKTLPKNSKIRFSNKFNKIQGTKNSYIFYRSQRGLEILDDDSNYTSIPIEKLRGIRSRLFNSLYLIGDTLYFYNNESKVVSYNLNGQFFDNDITIKNLLEVYDRHLPSEFPDSISRILKDKLKTGEFILLGDKYFTYSYKSAIEFYSIFEDTSLRGEDKVSYNLDFDHQGYYLIGYDNEHNSYWKYILGDKRLLLILSKYGQILDAFYYDNLLEDKENGFMSINVNPSGDLYFMVPTSKTVKFYELKKSW